MLASVVLSVVVILLVFGAMQLMRQPDQTYRVIFPDGHVEIILGHCGMGGPTLPNS